MGAEGAQVFERALGGVEGVEGEVELLARVAGEEGVAERGGAEAFGFEVVERVEVAERLAHLLAVNEEVFAVIPVVGEGRAVAALALGDFVFVVGEEEIHAAGVEVDGVAEDRFAHRAALDVPAGAAGAGGAGAGPLNVAVFGLVGLPEGEVAGVFFFVGVGGLGL